ncbi:hypothetical protein FACS1894181_17070 [Bacteroidia bacterium]|nr:hypothetical protein FACS1894181_17070 [Bacteroidia bacterium]
METMTVNAEEWNELARKIDRIAGFIEQLAERFPADDNAWLDEMERKAVKSRKGQLEKLRLSHRKHLNMLFSHPYHT